MNDMERVKETFYHHLRDTIIKGVFTRDVDYLKGVLAEREAINKKRRASR